LSVVTTNGTQLIRLIVNGGAGNDALFGSPGDDTFVWNPGDGSDTIDGEGGNDTLTFNGSDLAEKFDISDSGNGAPFHNVRLTRDLGGGLMDPHRGQMINLNAPGRPDTITVHEPTATHALSPHPDPTRPPRP